MRTYRLARPLAAFLSLLLLPAVLACAAPVAPARGAPAAITPAPSAAPRACPLPPSTGGPVAFLGPFPAPGSPEAEREREALLAAQAQRTAADIARARSEEDLTLEDYAGVLGEGFEATRHPRTQALLDRAARAASPCIGAGKDAYARQRPFLADDRLQPIASREPTPSYPSGHATRGALFASVLAELAPARREALLRRGEQIALDRVLAGVHYPSDVAAGQRLGLAVAAALLSDPDFRSALDEVCRAEWR